MFDASLSKTGSFDVLLPSFTIIFLKLMYKKVKKFINSTFKVGILKSPFVVSPKYSNIMIRFLPWPRPFSKSQSVFLWKIHDNKDLIYTKTSEKERAITTTAKMHVCDTPFADKFFWMENLQYSE